MLEMFAEDGALSAIAGGWRVESPLPLANIEQLEERLTRSEQCGPELGLMTRVGGNLAAALRGSCDVVDLLFPQGSLALAERLYEASPLFRPYNAAIQEAVTSAVARVPAGRRARVLEIGAGTGATTSRLLPRLPADALEYTFTDVSPLFLAKAREKFAAYPSVHYRVLDIERDPAGQGFTNGGFDVIVAANVLHATADLRTTLRHVQRLLAPGGVLILLEGAKPLRVGDLIVGLTDGWWRFSDEDLRQRHALMPPPVWVDVLRDTGFAEAAAWPASTAGSRTLTHHMVMVARRVADDAAQSAEAPVPGAGARGSWLVFADGSGLGDQVGQMLAARGARVVLVRQGEGFAPLGRAEYQLNPAEPAEFVSLLRAMRAVDPGGVAGVVHCWPLDLLRDADPAEGLRLGSGAVLHLVQALEQGHETPAALCLVTRGAQPAGGAGQAVNVAQAPVWGLANTIAREHPELRCVRIDLDQQGSADEALFVYRELAAVSLEEQVALRGNERYVARLAPAMPAAGTAAARADAGPEQLFVDTPGTIDAIAFHAAPRQAPGPGEVEIAVRVTGLNFRDVLRALGMYPDDKGEALGVECAGTITAMGSGVQHVHLGQRVMAIANGSFGTFVTTPAALVVGLPASLSLSDGATIPSVFLTAQYALVTLAQLQPGERVLVHAAAGGVGLAAIQVAQRAGAEVFATAGSPRKREFLHALGVAHVFDSRSVSFADDVRAATGGAGVDVVLNSLGAEFIGPSVELLGPAGRFVEIGRRGIWTEAQFHAARPAGAYFVVNLAETCHTEPELAGALLHELADAFAAGALRPLPLTSFPSTAVADAFRYMAQARHIGKVVVTRDAPPVRLPFEPAASYLITGGLSGVGLRVADWMVEHGARHLVLMGRSAPAAAAITAIAAMQAHGATVVVQQGDVSRADDVRAALARVPEGVPLRGVMHCAGVLSDGVLAQLDRGRFETVMAPKVAGSWHLHDLTRGLPLDFFLLFSSAVSILGSAGQGNHAAACAYQDALAWDRVASGLPAASINWGPWSDIGSVVRQNVGDRLKTKGLKPFGPEEGLAAIEVVLREPVPQVAVIRADWTAYAREVDGPRPAPFFERVITHAVERPSAAAPAQKENLAARLRAVTPTEGRKLLQAHVRQQIATVLGLDAGFRLEAQHGLRDLGIDSLMSIELRNRLQASLGSPLPSTLVFDYPTVDALTEYLAGQALASEAAAVPPAPAVDERERAANLAEIARLSQDEAEALLLEELSRGDGRRPV